MAVVELFRALGDPTRLELVRRLSFEAPQTITAVTRGLEISRQGARKHLQILVDTNVVKLKTRGRDTDVQLNHTTLEEGKVFIAELELLWDKRLKALRDFVEDDQDNNP